MISVLIKNTASGRCHYAEFEDFAALWDHYASDEQKRPNPTIWGSLPTDYVDTERYFNLGEMIELGDHVVIKQRPDPVKLAIWSLTHEQDAEFRQWVLESIDGYHRIDPASPELVPTPDAANGWTFFEAWECLKMGETERGARLAAWALAQSHAHGVSIGTARDHGRDPAREPGIEHDSRYRASAKSPYQRERAAQLEKLNEIMGVTK